MRALPRRASLGAALALLSSLPSALPSTARADTLAGTKASLVGERGNAIELRLDRGHATLVVRRTFENRSNLHDQAVLDITDFPTGAVATGLRTLGGTAKEPIWYAAELLDAEVAAERYRALTGIGGYYPKDPALLSWRAQRHLKLQVFPIAPKGEKTVEYTLTVPTTYVGGRYHLDLPAMQATLAATLTTRPAREGDAVFVDALPIAAGDVRRLLGDTHLSLRPADPPKLGGRFSSYTFAKGRALLHGAVEVGKPVSTRPANAHVVILLDGSRSLDEDDREAQKSAAKAYLRDLPDAKAQIVIFDRVARPLETGFVPSSQALADLAAATITPRNGSDLDVALADAAVRVATAPTGAPRRIVALTDLATRSTLVPARVTGLAASGAIVHLATVRWGEASTHRDDGDAWAVVPRATGGVLWRAQASAGNDAAAAAEVFEEWVRPLRVDRLSVVGVGLDVGTFDLPDTLAEGEGWDALNLQAYGTPALEIKGELWSTPITTVLSSTPDEERRWAALAIGSDLLGQLKDPEITTLATKGGAVSPMTSYLAIEPGVRPSTEGLDWIGHGVGIGDGIGYGSGSGRMGTSRAKANPDPISWLRDSLAQVAKGCGGGAASVRLETTWHEIVAVDVTPKVANDKYATCVREGAFGLELPEWFRAPWAKWEVEVSN
jgi:hypothetical protein